MSRAVYAAKTCGDSSAIRVWTKNEVVDIIARVPPTVVLMEGAEPDATA
jgi:hypothetical protein